MFLASNTSFSIANHLAKACLEYIHADLWGPVQVQTHGGNKYFLSLINDFSRKVWVFLLQSKGQTFSKFLEWKTLVENQTDVKAKVLKTDNGLEFHNVEFDEFCKNHGILSHRTIKNKPQQNWWLRG